MIGPRPSQSQVSSRSLGGDGKLSFLLPAVQVISGLLLGAMNFLPSVHPPEGGLSRGGWTMFVVSASLLMFSTIRIQVEVAQQTNDLRGQIEWQILEAERRTHEHMEALAGVVMERIGGTRLPPLAATGESIRISEPSDGATVAARQLVRGHVSEEGEEVWGVIHPLDTSAYWVQPRVSIGPNGDWQVLGYFGRSGSIDSGKKFEILAIADPDIELREGMVLDKWPSSRLVSELATVTRR